MTLKDGLNSTKKILSGEIKTGQCDIAPMLTSPEADTFIKSAKKQNAVILSDNIYKDYMPTYGKETYAYKRLISKLLPSGTTITNLYDSNGKSVAKAVVGKDKVAYAKHNVLDLFNFKNYTLIYTDNAKVRRPQTIVVKNPKQKAEFKDIFLPDNPSAYDLRGIGLNEVPYITNTANAQNEYYQSLLKNGVVQDLYFQRCLKHNKP